MLVGGGGGGVDGEGCAIVDRLSLELIFQKISVLCKNTAVTFVITGRVVSFGVTIHHPSIIFQKRK